MHSESLKIRNEQFVLIFAVLGAGLAASVFYTPLPLIAAIGVPLAIYFATRPYELLLFMVFLIPFNFIFKLGPVPVAAELLKVFVWIPFLATRHLRPKFISSRFNKWFAVIAIVILLSLIRAYDPPYTLKECIRLGSNLGLVYLCLNLIDTPAKMLQVFRILTVSTFVVACYGFYQWAIQDFGALFWIVNPRLDTSLAHYRDEFWEWRNRMISVLTSEMELGHYFNLCLPMTVMLWITEGKKRLTSKWLVMALSMLAGLVLTFTFGAWAGLVCTSVLFAFLLGRGRRGKMLVGGLLLLSLLAAFMAYGPLRPIVEAKASGDAVGGFAWDAATRLYAWKVAVQTWWAHPWIGAGIGNFAFLSADYDFVRGANSQGSSPHETYLYLLADFGLVGTAAILVIMFSTLRSNFRIFRSGSRTAIIALALAFALTSNLIGWLSDDSGFIGPHAGYLLWLFVGLSEVTARLNRQEMEAAAISHSR